MRGSFGTLFFILLTIIWSNGTRGNPARNKNIFSLTIVHTNDMHARFEQTSSFSGKCIPEDAVANKCYGGIARIATLVRNARNSSKPTLFLNAGDTYTGSPWFTVHRWAIVSRFLNILSPDAICLGNHEFDDGVDGLIPFLKNASYPVVTANLDLSEEPELAATDLKNSTVLTVHGTKIGIIGYLTPKTNATLKTGNIKFLDEVDSVRREVALLRSKGIKILIALGHSGFTMDKKIANEVDGIDLVIGGHTNTFLYTGKPPDREIPEGLYPTEIQQKNGRRVYVVQSYAHTKYLGNLTIDFDEEGEVKKIFGNPILVDSNVAQAPDILEELEKWRPQVDAIGKQVVGRTKVFLHGDSKCRKGECNLGNLITDAMVDFNVRQFAYSEAWTDAAIAIYNSGAIRNSIQKLKSEEIIMGDILSVLPFKNLLLKLHLNGSTFRKVLEHSVHSFKVDETTDSYGGYLQFSGVRVIYDLSEPVGSRVTSVQVRCARCEVPMYENLTDNETYMILLSDYLQRGGSGYSMFKDLNYTSMGITTDELLVKYLKAKSPVYPGVEGRIRYLITSDGGKCLVADPEHTSI